MKGTPSEDSKRETFGIWIRTSPYFIRVALRGIWESSSAALVATLSISIALLILGGSLLILSNMTRLLNEWGGQVRVVVYLKDEVDSTGVSRLRSELVKLVGVSKVQYVSKKIALENFRNHLGGRKDILDGLSPNPLPASFVLSIAPERRTSLFAAKLAATIRGRWGIESVDYGRAWVEGFERVVVELKWVVVGMGLFLGLGIILVVSNTIRLALLTRREEVEIMDLVGATPGFIRAPFLVEGLLEGFVGSGVSLGFLYLLYRLVLLRLVQGFPDLDSGKLAFLEPEISVGLLALGALLGALGSFLSFSRNP
jgi:cell division transport system permease protein